MAHKNTKPYTTYSRCPHCHTVFGLKAYQLTRCQGQVRCGNCFQLFYAPDCFVPRPSHALITTAQTAQVQCKRKVRFWRRKVKKPAPTITARHPLLTPLTLPAIHGVISQRRVVWGFANVALIFVFFLQWAWYERNWLATYDTLRPILTHLCKSNSCQLPLQQNVERIRITAQDLRAHPQYNNSLRLHAIMSNDADFEQPFAKLIMRFSNQFGQTIAERAFVAADYLSTSSTLTNMPSHTPIHLVLDVVDPGEQATGFTLAFVP